MVILSLLTMPLGLITNRAQYAIRPNVRGNKQLGRDIIIKTVADVVGPDHSVDLKNYDLLILVDVIQVRGPFHSTVHMILYVRAAVTLTVMMDRISLE